MLWLLGAIVVLLVAAAVYDHVAKRRGTYRGAAEWQQLTSRRRTVKREVKKRREPPVADD